MTDILSKSYLMKFSDGSTWAVPVSTIAMHHAMSHAHEQQVVDYLHQETIPLFMEDNSEIENWAKGNMDWSDVESEAVKVFEPKTLDYQQEWLDCKTMLK